MTTGKGIHHVIQATTNTKPHVPPQKILVIDDEDNYRAMISLTLKVMGYDTIEATN
jgi:PleD family two-component response regulator